MRIDLAIQAANPSRDDLLTTGEAATILGMSRQHIVNLCNAGDLPFIQVGSHRRISRSDIEQLRSGSRRTTKDQRRSLFLAYAVAGHLVVNPDLNLAKARENLRRMQAAATRGAARVWLDEWERLLDGPLQTLLADLTSPSQRSRELRQNSPFAGVLTEDERVKILETARN